MSTHAHIFCAKKKNNCWSLVIMVIMVGAWKWDWRNFTILTIISIMISLTHLIFGEIWRYKIIHHEIIKNYKKYLQIGARDKYEVWLLFMALHMEASCRIQLLFIESDRNYQRMIDVEMELSLFRFSDVQMFRWESKCSDGMITEVRWYTTPLLCVAVFIEDSKISSSASSSSSGQRWIWWWWWWCQ